MYVTSVETLRYLVTPTPTYTTIGTDKYIEIQTSTGLYRSCAALTSFSGTFDLILFQAVNFEFNVAYSTDTQKLNNYLILI